MKRSLRKPVIIIILISGFIIGNWLIFSPGGGQGIELEHRAAGQQEKPIYLGEIRDFGRGPGKDKPAWVYVYEDNLYVSYFDREIVDILTLKGEKTGDFRAKITKSPGAPEGMFKTGDKLLIADYHNGGLGIYRENGMLFDAYYETAEGRQIKPVGITANKNVFYLTDVSINGWLAVLDDGEMIMEVRGDDEKKGLEFPYGIVVTDDGRVVVTDPAGGKVKAFTCSGRYAYDFPVSEAGLTNPQGIDIDGFGRIHIVDNGTGKIFVFDNKGRFMFTYGKDLLNPSTIAVDDDKRIIYIANTEKNSISVWGY